MSLLDCFQFQKETLFLFLFLNYQFQTLKSLFYCEDEIVVTVGYGNSSILNCCESDAQKFQTR